MTEVAIGWSGGTGLYAPAANEIGFAISGALKAKVDATGILTDSIDSLTATPVTFGAFGLKTVSISSDTGLTFAAGTDFIINAQNFDAESVSGYFKIGGTGLIVDKITCHPSGILEIIGEDNIVIDARTAGTVSSVELLADNALILTIDGNIEINNKIGVTKSLAQAITDGDTIVKGLICTP